ncbi:MinD/ParA family ATP-binding protein [Microbacterium timonense]|uniref:MinD/ParA family ATP-binding protein n=1 Tax=Microbacterium timonense TaxID=2086576 RepID=UPI000D0F735A|nr:MinD/ParA family protein [Microbacterium timonense]
MTPDRTEPTPDETENGVLSDTGSVDTTGLGILGGATAQVNVELPTESDDDLADDDVIDDEVPFVVEIPADADLPTTSVAAPELSADTTEAEIIEVTAEEWTVEGEGFAPARIDEDIADADIVLDADEPGDSEQPGAAEPVDSSTPAADAAVGPDAHVTTPDPSTDEALAGEAVDEARGGPEAVEPASVAYDDVEYEEVDFDSDFDPAEFALGEDAIEATLAESAGTGDDVIATDQTPEDSMSATTPADDETAPETVAASEAAKSAGAAAASQNAAAPAATESSTPSGSVPTTRREAHTGSTPVAGRPADRAVERAFPRADVTLTSKRLGEFEPDRETADLLTADRLLDPHQVVRPEPEGAWQHFVYSISGRRINLGDSKRARARKELDRRIAAPLAGGARFVPVLSRKGGVGKTTITTLLGMALADARDDRVIAVDANPDRGTLAERISRESGRTVRDLVRVRGEVVGFNDLSTIVARDETRLDVVASDSDPRVSEAFNDADYRDVAALAAHYYSVVLTDTGTGIVHSVMGATLDLADQLVIVAGLSVDEARLASETLTWLETNGHADKVRNAVVVLNNARPGHPLVQLDELESHFRTRVRTVVRVPYDPHIAAGSAIVFRELQPATRQAARELAATVVEGLRALASAA